MLVRTFLSWALALEIAGRWPWQREPLVLGELSTRADKYDVLILGGGNAGIGMTGADPCRIESRDLARAWWAMPGKN